MGENAPFAHLYRNAMTAVAEPLLSLSHYYLPVYKPRQVVLERGQGARVWDSQGREYIDLAAGIAVSGGGAAGSVAKR